MNKLEKSLAILRKIVQETPKDVLEKHFEKYEHTEYEGATVEEYFSNFATNHNFLPSLENTKKEQIQDVTTSLRTDKEAEKEQDSYSSAA